MVRWECLGENWGKPSSASTDRRHLACLADSAAASDSAVVDDVAVMDCVLHRWDV